MPFLSLHVQPFMATRDIDKPERRLVNTTHIVAVFPCPQDPTHCIVQTSKDDMWECTYSMDELSALLEDAEPSQPTHVEPPTPQGE